MISVDFPATALALLLFLCLITGCQKNESVGSKRVVEVNQFKETCVGRYEFKMPSDFYRLPKSSGEIEFNGDPDKIGSISFTIEEDSLTRGGFAKAVQERMGELLPSKGKILHAFEELNDISPELKFFRIKKVSDSHAVEAHIYIEPVYVKATLDSYGNSYRVAEDELKKFADSVVVRKAGSETVGGFCAGAITITGDHRTEWITMNYRSQKRKDLLISVTVDTFRPDEERPLFQRFSGPQSLINVFDVSHKVLRKREFKVGEMRAQEWLAKILDAERKTWQHKFAMETLRPNPGATRPYIHVEFDSGQTGLDGVAHDTSINDDEAISLWDSMTASARLQTTPIIEYGTEINASK